MDPRRRRARLRLPTALPAALAVAALVLAAGLAVVVTPSPATAVETPSGLTASDSTIPVLSWDRVPGATAYDVELSRTGEFTAASRVGAVVSTVNVAYVPPTTLPAGTLHWRVRAKVGATLGEYTSSTVTTTQPAGPVPVRPLAGAQPFQAPEAPYFTWEPVAGATSYTVQAGPDPLFTDPAVPGYAERTQRTTAAYLTGYPSAGTYYWRVRAELGTGHHTAWAGPIPYVVEPLDLVERTGPGQDEQVTDVVLDWEPVAGAASYQLQVGTDNGFLENTLRANVSGITGTRWSPPTTLNNTTYFWRVRAVDSSGNPSAWPSGPPWQFRRAWPGQPGPVHPVGEVDPAEPFFYQWEPVERASAYQVVLFDSTGAEQCVSDRTAHTTLAPVGTLPAALGTACVPKTTGDYVWKVRAFDDPGNVVSDVLAAGTARAFHYEKPPAVTPAPAGTLSTDAVTGHTVTTTGTDTTSGVEGATCTATLPATCENLRQTPVLTWDPVPGAVSYRLTLSYDDRLTNVLSGYNGVFVPQPMFTFRSTLPDSQAGAAYLWVVQPCTGTLPETCAPIEYPEHGFAKKSIAPDLLAPVGGVERADDVTLEWTTALAAGQAPTGGADGTSSLTTLPRTDARSYLVQTSADPTFPASALIDNTTVDQTTFTSFTTTYPEGPVYWRVRAVDGSLNPTVWSDTGQFLKRSPRPVPLAPVAGEALAQDVTFRWGPVPFAASYEIEVYAGPTRVARDTTKHASWAPSDPLPLSTAGYSWRVRRLDVRGRPGAWSHDTMPFEPFAVRGLQPALATPDTGATVEPTGALFTWLPDPRATSYRFERRKPLDPSGTLAESVSTRATAYAPTTALPAGTTQWRVVALDTDGRELGSSDWRDFTVVDPPATARPVSVTGSGRVGTTLTAAAPSFDPEVESVTYQWFRVTGDSWSRIIGATDLTYDVTASDVGKGLAVEATGVRTGWRNAVSRSNEVPAVTGDALVAIHAPAVDGEPVVGRVLTVVPGTWPGTPQLTYQWHRDGEPISRATRTTYSLTEEDLGHEVTVVETARAAGRSDGTATSEPLVVVAPAALVATRPPAIGGTRRVGGTLTATTGEWPVAPRFTYQWFRNGAPIAGATRSSYSLAATDAARTVHVVVTATAPGWSPGTAESGPVAVPRMASTTSATLSATRATARQRVTLTADVAVAYLSSPGGTVTVHDGRRRLTAKRVGSGGAVTYRLPRLAPGRHTIKVAYAGTAQVAPSTRSVRLVVTRR